MNKWINEKFTVIIITSIVTIAVGIAIINGKDDYKFNKRCEELSGIVVRNVCIKQQSLLLIGY